MKRSAFILLSLFSQLTLAQGASGDAKNGKDLYYDFACHACHGYNATMRVPLVGDASGIMSDEQLFLSYLRLRADQNPVNPKNSMPNYAAATLSDEQALDIYAYIRSLEDDAPELEEIPVFVEILETARQRSGNESHEE
ncbi:MAG: cytochrome c [Woeseiaceae bacterium]|nr:cytochrome c [Woeseiaceae bacterium]